MYLRRETEQIGSPVSPVVVVKRPRLENNELFRASEALINRFTEQTSSFTRIVDDDNDDDDSHSRDSGIASSFPTTTIDEDSDISFQSSITSCCLSSSSSTSSRRRLLFTRDETDSQISSPTFCSSNRSSPPIKQVF